MMRHILLYICSFKIAQTNNFILYVLTTFIWVEKIVKVYKPEDDASRSGGRRRPHNLHLRFVKQRLGFLHSVDAAFVERGEGVAKELEPAGPLRRPRLQLALVRHRRGAERLHSQHEAPELQQLCMPAWPHDSN